MVVLQKPSFILRRKSIYNISMPQIIDNKKLKKAFFFTLLLCSPLQKTYPILFFLSAFNYRLMLFSFDVFLLTLSFLTFYLQKMHTFGIVSPSLCRVKRYSRTFMRPADAQRCKCGARIATIGAI